MSYQNCTSIVAADQAATLNEIAGSLGIEGATNQMWTVPLWPEGADPEVDDPSHFGAAGWMHVDLIALLPEGSIVPEPEPEPEP